jgi:hypothetical protein
MNFAPVWELVEKTYSSGGKCQACDYLKHFTWMSSGSELPANGLQRGSLHIGIAQ